jgi:topoisomerase-4 subunit A
LIEQIKAIEADIKQVKYDLDNLTDFAVTYFETCLKNMAKEENAKQRSKNLIPSR